MPDHCLFCGGTLTEGQKRRHDQEFADHRAAEHELDSTYGHLRAVIENCRQTKNIDAIRHQLVGLLPEVRPMDAGQAGQLRERGMGHLVERHEAGVQEAWREFGYGGPDA